ncbi:MAG: response regulator [Pseudomonadota bacterium]|uniref:response regulator n=1 Tax=Phenylobacterium sp. TaxID=1871053 RepID=UPI0009E7D643|nr:response regulator [Phenylobacterium sp.]
MGLNPESRARFNLERASVLLLEESPMGMSILVQILTGFGAKTLHRCEKVEEAKDAIGKVEVDLIICDALGASGAGYDFVEWLRGSRIEPNCYVPVLLTAGHTPSNAVARARDCGAHFVMAKPLTPIAVLERILWIAREGRRFVECDTYMGPDRRFKNEGVPSGMVGRRRDDLHGDIGQAETPNMDQEVIDSLMKTRRVEL